LVSLIFVSIVILLIFSGCEKTTEPVELTFASWRIDDVTEMNRINALYTKAHPEVSIRFEAYDPLAYQDIEVGKLSKGEGADILFLWSYDKGRELFDAGYLYDLTTKIPNLSAYAQIPLKAWTTQTGVTYGVPSVGVTHGIYYHKAIFDKYKLKEPTTWDEFIAACETMYYGGEQVIAQGLGDNWTLSRIVFSGLGANFYGGEASRLAFNAGTMKLTDPKFIEAFRMVESLKKYFPKGMATMDYEYARDLFAEGKAAMFIGGSWDISVLEELGANSSKIGWFAPPVKKAGDKLQYCFHVDAGIGVNKNSKNLEAALDYIKWVSGSEYAQAFMTELPGFFSYTPGTVNLTNTLAQEMLGTAATADLTVRLMYEKYNSKSPGGDAILAETLADLLTGKYTPETAAAYIQGKLDLIYK